MDFRKDTSRCWWLHVTNYDVPKLAEGFIHRIGRMGRAGSHGRATTLVTGADAMELRQIERTLKLSISRKQLDRPAGINLSKLFKTALPRERCPVRFSCNPSAPNHY